MWTKSNIVTSNQESIHDDLSDILKRYKGQKYQRPIAEFSKATFEHLKKWIQEHSNKELVLDMGCGTGESSYHLALKYPDKLIIGIDKSLDRLERNNDFKKKSYENLKLVRGELLDLWYLFYLYREEFTFYKQYILYPNPWPKKKLVKKRFHANPIWPFIIEVCPHIEMRTNWKIYAKEFIFAYKFMTGISPKLDTLNVEKPITTFERKYNLSEQELYKVIVHKD